MNITNTTMRITSNKKQQHCTHFVDGIYQFKLTLTKISQFSLTVVNLLKTLALVDVYPIPFRTLLTRDLKRCLYYLYIQLCN